MLLTMWGIVMKRKKYRLWQSCMVMLLLIQSLKGNPLDLKAIYSEQISIETNKALEQIAQDYEEITEVITIGYSTTKQTEIKALKLGKGEKSILINGTHHGREALTTVLILNQISYLAEAYVEKQTINGQDVRTVLNTVSIWFVPLVNPDGATIALSTRPEWKANGRGVDLNRNYPTLYATIATKPTPGPSGYAGIEAFSELETQALRDLCKVQEFEAAIAYHSAGEVIYWWYHQTGELYKHSLVIGRMLSHATQYSLVPISQSRGGRGFTDWFIQSLKKPSFTLEVGKNANGKRLSLMEYDQIWKANKEIPFLLAKEMINLNSHEWQVTINEAQIKGKTIFGRGVVPVKGICQALNLNYSYMPEQKQISLTDGNNILSFKQGEKIALYNEEPLEIVVPAHIQEGEMYLPLKNILELFSM